MNNAVIRMRMHPIKTTAIGSDANILWNSNALSIYIDRKVCMDVVAILHHWIARNAINWWMGRVSVQNSLHAQEDDTDQPK